MCNNRIILNHIISKDIKIASPIPNIINNYLKHSGLNSILIYWNIKLIELQHSFIWNTSPIIGNDENSLLLFFNYLAINNNDKKAYINVKSTLMSLQPNHTTSEVSFFDKHMNLYAQKLSEMIDGDIDEVYSDETLCFVFFSEHPYEWICASIIAERIKQKHTESIIVIGGTYHKDTAVSYLQNVNQFDFAIWGEMEHTMLVLCNYLIGGNKTYEDIPCLVFRRDNVILTTANRVKTFIPFTNQILRPDYSDFFEQKKSSTIYPDNLPILSIEINRKRRHKPINTIIDEIAYFINENQNYAFHFSGYEPIGNNQSEFNRLLDAIIPIKEAYPDFSISLTRVEARAISPALLYKMVMAGFYSVQTDYISASENLLKKCEAKSSFAEHILFVKFASLYHIILTEADIVMGIPGEADEDILQAISNLYYLRFFFSSGLLRHRMKKVEVTRHSKCYKQVKMNQSSWEVDPFLKRFFPSNHLNSPNNRNADIISLTPIQVNPLWEDFKHSESYFMQNKFEYKLYQKPGDTILYKELFNQNVIGEFELESIDWLILEKANAKVVDIEYLLEEIKANIKKEFMEVEIINILENLKSERLLYISDDYREIVSIINTEFIINNSL